MKTIYNRYDVPCTGIKYIKTMCHHLQKYDSDLLNMADIISNVLVRGNALFARRTPKMRFGKNYVGSRTRSSSLLGHAASMII